MLGIDPGDRACGRELRERIGLVLQDIAVEPYLTVRETVARNAGYYPAPRDVDEVISLVGLAGQRAAEGPGAVRRPEAAAGPRAGHDRRPGPAVPRRADDRLRPERAPGAPGSSYATCASSGTTIVLTTHYMDEAQALADRVAVISGGRIIAEGTPSTLGGRDTAAGADPLRPARRMRGRRICRSTQRPGDGLVTVETAEPTGTLHRLTGWALRRGTVLGGPHRRTAQPGGRLPAPHRPRRDPERPDRREHQVTSPRTAGTRCAATSPCCGTRSATSS